MALHEFRTGFQDNLIPTEISKGFNPTEAGFQVAQILDLQARNDAALINRLVGAIIVATSEESHKKCFYSGLAECAGVTVPIESAYPNRVPEARFNGYTNNPELVAALKLLQLVHNPQALISNIVGMMPEKPVILIASDVMLDLASSQLKAWQPKNKFSPQLTKDMIFSEMRKILAGTDVSRQARFRVGEAILDPIKNRGAVHTEEVFITYQPLLDEELAIYVYGLQQADEKGFDIQGIWGQMLTSGIYSDEELSRIYYGQTLEQLQSTNFGIQFEHPLWQEHILEINGTGINQQHALIERAHMIAAMMGVASNRLRFIAASLPFILCERNNQGNYSVHREARTLGLKSDHSVWLRMEPQQLLV